MNNGMVHDYTGAKPDCVGCRFGSRCVVGSGVDPNSQRSQAYI
jgi:hypothetical protein